MFDEKIKQLINSKIDTLEKQQQESIDNYQKNKKTIESTINDLKNIKDDYNLLKKYNIDSLEENNPILNSSKEILTLSFFKIVLNQGFDLQESDILKLNTIVLEFIKKYEKELIKLETNYKNNQNKEEINKLKNILLKLKKYDLDENDLDLLKEILLHNNNIRESVEIMKYIINEVLKNSLIPADDIMQETNLDFNSLKELLNEYSINLEELKPLCKEELLKYGSLTNISNIISVLKENNLFNKEIFYKYQLPITRILIYSNEELVENIIKSYQKENININTYLNEFYKRPAKFIKRKRKWQGKSSNKTSNKENSKNTNEEIGSYEDFISNMALFSKIGINVDDAYKKSSTLFEKAHSHILTGYNNLNLYGITPNYYANTLTVFITHKQLETIDMFIELDAYNYVLNNMSRVNYLPTSLIFHKLYRLKKQGIPVSALYKTKGTSIVLPLEITDEKLSYDGLNKDNMLEENNIFLPNDIFKTYDNIINQSDNNFIQEDISSIIKKLDDTYLVKDEGILKNKLYNIEGIHISRLKVLRYLTTLIFNGINLDSNVLLYAITKNSLLTKEEFDKIKTNVDKLLNEKVR